MLGRLRATSQAIPSESFVSKRIINRTIIHSMNFHSLSFIRDSGIKFIKSILKINRNKILSYSEKP